MSISPNILSNRNYISNCSVDTNILIAVYNEEDRLHQSALKLMNCVNNLYIGFAVIDETIITFGRKIREVMARIILFYSKLNLKSPEDEIINKEDELLSQLNTENPRNINFHKFIIKKAREIRKKSSSNREIIHGLIRLHKELNDASHILDTIINKILNVNSNINFYPYFIRSSDSYNKKLKDVLDTIDDIKFKDDNDKRIFVELVVCYPAEFELPVVFVSDDKEFIKKARRAVEKLKPKYGEHYFDDLIFEKLIDILSKNLV
jgi:predicted nucleic acid-binding protein